MAILIFTRDWNSAFNRLCAHYAGCKLEVGEILVVPSSGRRFRGFHHDLYDVTVMTQQELTVCSTDRIARGLPSITKEVLSLESALLFGMSPWLHLAAHGQCACAVDRQEGGFHDLLPLPDGRGT